ncbi:MAG: hypothetical protein ABSA97_11475 [Verrucomicrobiia bacterium]
MKTKLPLLAIGSALLLIGCYDDRPRGYVRSPAVEASYTYVYYPDAEVYFEPHRHVYYWSEGGAWRSGARVPRNIVLRSSVRVDLDSPEPYRHHDEVRTKYPRHTEEKERGR